MAVLIGLERNQAFIWNVYSESARAGKQLRGDDEYNFFESIVEELRPSIRQGIKSVLIAAPDKEDYMNYMRHIQKHQSWLFNRSPNTTTFGHIPERAMNADQVRELVKSPVFKKKLAEVYEEDLRQVMDLLKKRLNDRHGIETLLFALNEVENAIYGNERNVEYILVSDVFRHQNWERINRLLQIAANKDVRTKIIMLNTPLAARISQFGGLICILRQ